MTPIDPNAPAFPRSAFSSPVRHNDSQDGLTIRAELAARIYPMRLQMWSALDRDEVACRAVADADALIRALNTPSS